MTAEPLPLQLHAERLHDLVALYLAEALERGDLGALGPLRLLRDRVEYLLAEHARAAHEGDGRPWREVAKALGVTTSAVDGVGAGRSWRGGATGAEASGTSARRWPWCLRWFGQPLEGRLDDDPLRKPEPGVHDLLRPER